MVAGFGQKFGNFTKSRSLVKPQNQDPVHTSTTYQLQPKPLAKRVDYSWQQKDTLHSRPLKIGAKSTICRLLTYNNSFFVLLFSAPRTEKSLFFFPHFFGWSRMRLSLPLGRKSEPIFSKTRGKHITPEGWLNTAATSAIWGGRERGGSIRGWGHGFCSSTSTGPTTSTATRRCTAGGQKGASVVDRL